jgi:hypothetical protein
MATSLPTLRRSLARSLDDIGIYGIASATATTVTITALADSTTNASSNRYDGRWVYFASGTSIGTQRRVTAGGFTPGTGTLTFELGGVTAGAGDIVELTALYPAVEQVQGEDSSYRSIVNRAAGYLAKRAEVETAITTAYSYPLDGFPYVDRAERLVRVLEPGPTGRQPINAAWRGWRWRPDTAGGFLELSTPFTTASGALTLEVIRPVKNWVYTAAGGWATSLDGLTNETDFFDLNEEDLLDTARMVAYETLVARTPGRPLPGAADQAKFWRERAMASILWDHTQMAPPPPQAATAGAAA